MKSAILGKKIGMTSFFTKDGRQVPCTIIEAGPCPVVLVRTPERDGYKAVQIGFGDIEELKVNKPVMGHFKSAGIVPTRHLKEFRDFSGEVKVGDVFTAENSFAIGDKVRVTGTSIGRGFQGVIKRHHFSGVGMATHGQSDRQRHPGSIGSSSYPSRVFKSLRMAGRMGGTRISIRNMEIVQIIPEKNLILLKGSVPGASSSLLEIIKQ